MAEDIQPFAYTETTAAKERELIRQKLNEVIEVVNDLGTVGNGKITVKQGGATKGDFTVNQSEDKTIELDAGGGDTPNDSKITITQNGVEKGFFTLNQSTDKTINIDAGGGESATFESLGGEPRDNEKLAEELTALEDAIDAKADSSALTTETTERESEDTALWTGVNEEAATRQTEDEALRADIDANAGDIAGLQADLTQEIADREAADDAKENKLPNATAAGMFLKSTNTIGGKEWANPPGRTVTDITSQLSTYNDLKTQFDSLNIGDEIISDYLSNDLLGFRLIKTHNTSFPVWATGFISVSNKFFPIRHISFTSSGISIGYIDDTTYLPDEKSLTYTTTIAGVKRVIKITYT